MKEFFDKNGLFVSVDSEYSDQPFNCLRETIRFGNYSHIDWIEVSLTTKTTSQVSFGIDCRIEF